MEVMLDTDVLINVMRGKEFLPTKNTYSISLITLYEVVRGSKDPYLMKKILEVSFKVYPLENEVILKAAELYRQLRKEGIMVGEADLLIAATAIANDVTLFTHNVKHFARFTPFGLRLYHKKE